MGSHVPRRIAWRVGSSPMKMRQINYAFLVHPLTVQPCSSSTDAPAGYFAAPTGRQHT